MAATPSRATPAVYGAPAATETPLYPDWHDQPEPPPPAYDEPPPEYTEPEETAAAEPEQPAEPTKKKSGSMGSKFGGLMGSVKGAVAKVPGSAMVSSKAAGLVQSLKVAKATVTSSLGVKYSTENFRKEFNLPTQPMFGAYDCFVVNGPTSMRGQLYVAPEYLCLYILGSKEIKVSIAFTTIHAMGRVLGQRAKEKGASPTVLTSIPTGARPNGIQVFCDGGVMHTIIEISDYWEATNLVSACWCTLMPRVTPLPLPNAPTKFHGNFNLPLDTVDIGSFSCRLTTGDDYVHTVLYITPRFITFYVKTSKITIPFANITDIVRATTLPSEDPNARVPVIVPVDGMNENAIQIFTRSMEVHQAYRIDNYKPFYNLLRWVWCLSKGAVPDGYL